MYSVGNETSIGRLEARFMPLSIEKCAAARKTIENGVTLLEIERPRGGHMSALHPNPSPAVLDSFARLERRL